MSQPIMLTDVNFEKEISAAKAPYLLEFYATWCGHCHNMEPVIRRIAKDYEGKMQVYMADVDKSPKAVEEYMVTSMPTMFVYKDKDDVEKLVGEQSYENLKQHIDNILK